MIWRKKNRYSFESGAPKEDFWKENNRYVFEITKNHHKGIQKHNVLKIFQQNPQNLDFLSDESFLEKG